MAEIYLREDGKDVSDEVNEVIKFYILTDETAPTTDSTDWKADLVLSYPQQRETTQSVGIHVHTVCNLTSACRMKGESTLP